ncbi:MAG: HD domain-containing protein, partial [Candidatus Cloacimonetes bacterium]|nr:HD domain-containing protein [Candidatus Cloacimonadota bacterium]
CALPISWSSILLYEEDGSKRQKNLAACVFHCEKELVFDNIYEQNVFDTSGTKSYDLKNNYTTRSIAAFPIKDHENSVLGVIQLINALDDDNEIISFTQEHIAMLNSLNSLAATILTNKKLIENLETLLHQFIRSIARAIDRKSRFTAHHIDRVALISEQLLELFMKQNHTRKFSTDEINELSLAAWLHDVGKIVTPEHIINKATKLEKIIDRIELINERINTIELAVKFNSLDEQNREFADKQSAILEKLTGYRQFLHEINFGEKFLSDEMLSVLEEIFRFRYEVFGKQLFIINEDEKNNLAVRKGTFLPEEMQIMKDHAVATKEMLAELTFPKKYKNVALYAGAHHEKINGKGYPDGLQGDQLPTQARIIAIADTFEALTAKDRPYKKANSLSTSLKILALMAKDSELDKDILDILLDSGYYLDYAKQFLESSQIDDVDIKSLKAVYH